MRILGKLEMIACCHYFFICLMVLQSVISGHGEQCKAITELRWKNVNVTVTAGGLQYINPSCRIMIPKVSKCTGYCNCEDILDLNTLNTKSACRCCQIDETTKVIAYPKCWTGPSKGRQFLRSIKDYTYIKVKSCRCKTMMQMQDNDAGADAMTQKW